MSSWYAESQSGNRQLLGATLHKLGQGAIAAILCGDPFLQLVRNTRRVKDELLSTASLWHLVDRNQHWNQIWSCHSSDSQFFLVGSFGPSSQRATVQERIGGWKRTIQTRGVAMAWARVARFGASSVAAHDPAGGTCRISDSFKSNPSNPSSLQVSLMASETVVGVIRVGVNSVDVLRWSTASFWLSRLSMNIPSNWPKVHVCFVFFLGLLNLLQPLSD